MKGSDIISISLILHTGKNVARIASKTLEMKIIQFIEKRQFGLLKTCLTVAPKEEMCLCFITWQKSVGSNCWKCLIIFELTGRS